MTDSLIPFALLMAAAGLWWHASVQALDRARACARDFCRRQQWQLLDQTVSLRALRPVRGARGLCLRRHYAFEFSADRQQRLAGGLITLGSRPVRIWADGPEGRVIEDL